MLIALGDGGAHVDMLCDAGYPTYLLGTWVRERQIMTLEQAITRLTAQPADLFGIKGRGRLAVGQAADIAIFDPDTIGSASRGERRFDLPGGAKRMVMPSRGVEYTIVNGSDRLRRRPRHRRTTGRCCGRSQNSAHRAAAVRSLRLRQPGLAQPFGDAGGELGRHSLGYIAHHGGDGRFGISLTQALQTFARLFAPAKMAAQAQLEAQRGQPGISAQRTIGPRQCLLVAAGGQVSEAQREIGGR